jgi:GNAT superfamily N-acetyltransferase
MSYLLRTLTLADTSAVVPVLDAAYGRSSVFESRFRMHQSIEPDGWVGAHDASGMIGVGGFVSFGACAYIGLMAVRPDAQRRGVGDAVFREILRRCDALGRRLLLLDASAAGAPLYERHGFEDRGVALGYTIDRRVVNELPGSPSVTVEPFDGQGSSADDVAKLDARCYGADRGALVRALLRELPGRAFVARDRATGEMVGYSVGQSRSFGPCMATSTDAARALLRRTLTLPYEGEVTWLVAGQSSAARALAERVGGSPTRTLRHMRRGAALLESDWSSLFAKASLAVG